jgi:hypothetical protein
VASALALVVGKSFFAFGLDKNCDPNYSSCVPIKQDVDCVDIGGDGGEIQVLGKDIYGLDRDGDGRACEWNNN